MDKTEIYKSIALSVTRFLLGGITAYLVQKGVVSQDQTDFLVAEAAAAVFFVGSLVWIWIKTHAQAQLQDKLISVALQSNPADGVTAEHVKAIVTGKL